MAVKAKTIESRLAELEKIVSKITSKPIKEIQKKLEVGDTFTLADLECKILDITENGYLCLSEKLPEDMKFDSSCNNWSNSSLRKYLNSEFLEKLEKEVGEENIVSFERDLLSMDGQKEYGRCEDKVSLLNVDEYRKYREYIPNAGYWWWLITADSTACNDDSRWVRVVSPSGRFYDDGCNGSLGVRPFCIFSSDLFESEDD